MSAEGKRAETLQVVVFSLLDELRREDYGVDVELIREIRPPENVTRLPKAPSYIKGITNLRGKIIPIVSLKEKLGLPSSEEAGRNSRILVAEIGGATFGLLVDQVEQVMRVPVKDVEQSSSEVLQRSQYIKGIAKAPGRLIVLLDLQKLLEDVNIRSGAMTRKD